MMGEHNCELLDEVRFAAPNYFVEEQGYEYYDMSREHEKMVRACKICEKKFLGTVTVQNQYTRSHITPNLHKPSLKGLNLTQR